LRAINLKRESETQSPGVCGADPMSVLLVTIPVSLLLAAGFILFFLHLARADASDPDRDGLLPLDEERPATGNPRSPGKNRPRH